MFNATSSEPTDLGEIKNVFSFVYHLYQERNILIIVCF